MLCSFILVVLVNSIKYAFRKINIYMFGVIILEFHCIYIKPWPFMTNSSQIEFENAIPFSSVFLLFYFTLAEVIIDYY